MGGSENCLPHRQLWICAEHRRNISRAVQDANDHHHVGIRFEEDDVVAVGAGEAVVPASELAAARAEIAKLQRVLGKKTLENEILKEAVEIAAAKKWIARSPLLPGDDR